MPGASSSTMNCTRAVIVRSSAEVKTNKKKHIFATLGSDVVMASRSRSRSRSSKNVVDVNCQDQRELVRPRGWATYVWISICTGYVGTVDTFYCYA